MKKYMARFKKQPNIVIFEEGVIIFLIGFALSELSPTIYAIIFLGILVMVMGFPIFRRIRSS